MKLIALLAVFACCGLGVKISVSHDSALLREQRAQSQKELGVVSEVANQVLLLEGEIRERESHSRIVESIREAKAIPMKLINALVDVTPSKAWLTDIQQDHQNVRLIGFAQDGETVSVFVRELNSNPLFESVELDSVRQGMFQGAKFQEFVIRSRISLAEPMRAGESHQLIQEPIRAVVGGEVD
jgi:Tfp pilus assembly protein PilN